MIALAQALLALALIAQSAAVLPLGYHRRVVDGWTLLAVTLPIADYTVCLADRPDTSAVPEDPDILARIIVGHTVERLDGDEPARIVRRLLAGRAPSGSREASIGEVDRHLLALSGARWRALGAPEAAPPGPTPILLLAGRDEPDVLMEMLVSAAGSLPAVAASDRSAPTRRPPVTGWWRHLETEGPPRVAIAVPAAAMGPELEVGARLAVSALEYELGALDVPPLVRRLELDDGTLSVFEWAVAPDSVPALRAAVTEGLARLRRSVVDRDLFLALRDALVTSDRTAIRRPDDRWLSSLLAAQLGGGLPRSAHEARRVWDRLARESVREAARSILPHDAVVVSTGRLAPGDRSAGPEELWPDPAEVYVDALGPDALAALAAYALERARRGLWGDLEPAGVTTETDWVLARQDGPLTGRLVETLRFPDAIRRDYYPAGPDLVFSTWLVADSLRASIQGAPRDTLPGERTRLVDRRDADVWNVVRSAIDAPGQLEYVGIVQADGEVFQGLTLDRGDRSVRIWLDPETGLPARVFIDRGENLVTSEYRYSSYVWGEGTRYPGRIERHVGARREAVQTVGAHAPATRLAASERLK